MKKEGGIKHKEWKKWRSKKREKNMLEQRNMFLPVQLWCDRQSTGKERKYAWMMGRGPFFPSCHASVIAKVVVRPKNKQPIRRQRDQRSPTPVQCKMVHFHLVCLHIAFTWTQGHKDTKNKQQPHSRSCGGAIGRERGDAADRHHDGTTRPRIIWFSPLLSTLVHSRCSHTNEGTIDFDTLA